MVTFTEKQLQLVSPGIVEWQKSEWLKDVLIRMEVNNNGSPFVLINNSAKNDQEKKRGFWRTNMTSSKISFYTRDNRYLKVTLEKLKDKTSKVNVEEIRR